MSPGQWLFLYGAKDVVLFDVLAHLETALTLIQRITRIRLLYIELAFLQFKLFSSLIYCCGVPWRVSSPLNELYRLQVWWWRW